MLCWRSIISVHFCVVNDFIVPAYVLTDGSSEAEEDSFYRDLSRLSQPARNTGLVILASGMNSLVDRLVLEEAHLVVDAQHTGNGERIPK
ncbi:hypothetical protein CLF_108311 [Clonorchis sinensis]|uniref:Uncharacterized protein n=1 Tax=Clonorchis sinensis TaxID=79923 RepID=G7YHW6_CLOSI|nr:hypothetical protein CLF_108311 [Clonorchis sinensis]